MAKCIIVSGTRVCDGGEAYRINNRSRGKRFPTLTKANLRRYAPIIKAVRQLGADPAQTKLATSLLQIVMAETWDSTKTANSRDIEQSVRLMLRSEVGKLDGEFTLVAY
ncbi:MAG: hypothetical protein CVV20_03530 [Gemmatimonadetes bacterium HGW-Gemmatimonadetes-1]|nr:MAG: hypothetical protein CVV20_03530 [Gemmatimonadetes bacterium HGW-Gemmatimonadetes-1]